MEARMTKRNHGWTTMMIAGCLLAALSACAADNRHSIGMGAGDGGAGEAGLGDAAGGNGNGEHLDAGNGNAEPDAGNPIEYHSDASCATNTESVELAPLDMILALDTSFSMDFLGKWPSVKQAVNYFAADPDFEGLGVGVQYFPIRKQCNAEEYAKPAVPVQLLPDNTQEIADSLAEQRMSGGTPMAPMLQGLLEYAGARAEQYPDRDQAIILATDGIPDSTCISSVSGALPNTIENVVALAEQGASDTPAVSTFVIGVGSELGALDQIAQAGGGTNAFLVDTSQNIEKAFLDALAAIRKRALSCEYSIPTVSGNLVIAYERVNVFFITEEGEEFFYNVANKDACQGKPESAWYYDDPDDPQRIVLCPETCDKVQSVAEGAFDVQFGCDTLIF
jgi:Mg-chelatase subunit ChlD